MMEMVIQITIWEWLETLKEQIKEKVNHRKVVNKMFFSEKHEQDFLRMVQKRFGKVFAITDSEYSVAFYLMSFVSIQKTLKYVTSNGIRFDDMIENECFSSGEKFLIKVAQNLYRSNGQIDLSDMLILGGDFYLAFQNAIKIRRGADIWQK